MMSGGRLIAIYEQSGHFGTSMHMNNPVCFFWFRRDLRLEDNHGLFHALKEGNVVGLFIFDRNILEKLDDTDDRRVNFLHRQVLQIKEKIEGKGGRMEVRYGTPIEVWDTLSTEYTIQGVYANEDYEPYARTRDMHISSFLKARGTTAYFFKDQVLFAPNEITSGSGKPYAVYTPFSKVWLTKLEGEGIPEYPSGEVEGWATMSSVQMPGLSSMGFEGCAFEFPSTQVRDQIIRDYAETRNTPALDATSHLGIHLRFGTVSPRQLVNRAKALSLTFTKELAWREFFMHILWHNPHVVDGAYRPAYDAIPWRSNAEDFERWCEGNTGYPIVDAGMRELKATGFMHNRVRMIAASFLVKHLLLDWRLGEAWFARWLLDFELASNNGNWQWVAGTGCDASPYFRVFNPETQAQKFDPKGAYIRKWVPEVDGLNYPKPMVEHKMARQRAIDTYKQALGKA